MSHVDTRGRPDPGALLGVSEVAEKLGVQKNTVQVWRRRHIGFPEPLVVLAGGPVWWAPEVDAWQANRPHLGAGADENGA